MTSRLCLYTLESHTYSNVSISSGMAPESKPHRLLSRLDNRMASSVIGLLRDWRHYGRWIVNLDWPALVAAGVVADLVE